MTRTTWRAVPAHRVLSLRLAGFRPYLFALIGFLLLCANASAANLLDRTIPFDIAPNSSLDDALIQWGAQSGVQVMMDTNTVAREKVPGVRGAFRAEDALAALLTGSGLSYRVSDSTVTVIPVAKAEATPHSFRTAEAQTPAGEGASEGAGAQSGGALSNPPGDTQSESGKQEATGLEEVVVTGTHIRGILPSSPVITIDRDQIDRSGYTDIGDVIRSLPQNFSGGNSPQAIIGLAPGEDNSSASGGSAPNLRGLGSGSTLTLINGHRLAQDAFGGAVDITGIPLDAVERVEVLTDGASATYGADAVAGVVNIITKKNYNGAQTTATVSGSSDGGASENRFSQLLGKAWSGGDAFLNYEYDHLTPVLASQRAVSSSAFEPTDILPGTNRNSLFFSGHQDVTDDVSVYTDGLYTNRNTFNEETYAPGETAGAHTLTHQYADNVGTTIHVPHDWRLEAVAGAAEQRSDSYVDQAFESQEPEAVVVQEGKLASAEITADGPLFELPAGAVRGALGGGYRHESYYNAMVGSAAPYVDVGRSVRYAYAESVVPLVENAARAGLRQLELNVSGRYDGYTDSGGKTVPKIGLLYVPVRDVTIRASWGKSFRAPPLSLKYEESEVIAQNLPDSAAPSGITPAILASGGNTLLSPETATSSTFSVTVDPSSLPGARVTATYYHVLYTNRIYQLPSSIDALTNPADAPFVTRSPSLGSVQSLIASAVGGFYNDIGPAYSPANIGAIVNIGSVNVASEDLNGGDLQVAYRKDASRFGVFEGLLNYAYLNISERYTPDSPEVFLSGTIYNPPRNRLRGALTWSLKGLSVTGTANFVAGERNTLNPDASSVASWTTFDAQLSWTVPTPSWPGYLKIVASAQNILNRSPPTLLLGSTSNIAGLNYDPLNANPLGRYGSLSVVKSW
jgi:iron complex outermembrane recepter protein